MAFPSVVFEAFLHSQLSVLKNAVLDANDNTLPRALKIHVVHPLTLVLDHGNLYYDSLKGLKNVPFFLSHFVSCPNGFLHMLRKVFILSIESLVVLFFLFVCLENSLFLVIHSILHIL